MLALGLLPWAARAVSRTPWLPNAVLKTPGLSQLTRKVAGVTTNRPAPHFAPTPFRRGDTARAHRNTVEASVVVWPDTFTDAFRPGLAEDLVAVLEATGDTVAVPSRWACCARTLYDGGMLDRARSSLTELVEVLEPWTSRGIPVVVPEPSCLASFRDELPKLLPDNPAALALAGLARSPAEHVLRSLGFAEIVAARQATTEAAPAASPVVVHPHCHGRAIGTPKADVEVLTWLGLAAGIVDGGCCGLAGSFGYRA